MQSAETVLGVLRERGERGSPLNELYRQLFNPQLYLLAYGRIYSHTGAMTPGATGETVDGMSLDKIGRIIDAMRHERFRFSPARRVYIPKKNGRKRPLGLPTWTDKIVGEVVRLLLEAYYEPTFSDRSHGFRPGRGCHTALTEIANTWTGTAWFVEADIADCFGSLDHETMIKILSEKIHDNRFLNLIRGMLRAGYLEDWTWNATHSGCPQGGTASPIMSNIYLSKLDDYIEKVLIPEHTRGEYRRRSRAYGTLTAAIGRARGRGDREAVKLMRKQQRAMPSVDPDDPGYRRLRYIRYADDHLLGFSGPKAEAEEIKQQLARFLHDDLKLELSADKTLITHARTRAARFLGYEITVQHNDTMTTRNRRSINGTVRLGVPKAVLDAKRSQYLQRSGKPLRRTRLMNEHPYTIISTYGAEYRGFAQYYMLAANVSVLNHLRWDMERSMFATLAAKHRATPWAMRDRYKTVTDTPHGKRRCFQAQLVRPNRPPLIARFGGIPLRRQKNAVLTDHVPTPGRGTQLIARLLAGVCELCGGTDGITVHHVRRLADLEPPDRADTPRWAKLMSTKRRKTLIVCVRCHSSIHHQRDNS